MYYSVLLADSSYLKSFSSNGIEKTKYASEAIILTETLAEMVADELNESIHGLHHYFSTIDVENDDVYEMPETEI